MSNLRPVLIIGLVFLAYMIWVEWQKDYGPAPKAPEVAETRSLQDMPGIPEAEQPDLPSAGDLPSPESTETESVAPGLDESLSRTGERVTVRTDVLDVQIDLAGGTLVSATLLDYPIEQKEPDRTVQLMQPSGPGMFIAQSGLISRQDAPNHTSKFSASAQSFELAPGAGELRVPLTWSSESGLEVTKTYVFTEGEYVIDVEYRVVNRGAETWTGSRYEQLQRTVSGDESSGGFTNPERYSFFGIGFYNPEDKFEKQDFDDVADDPYQKSTTRGWLAMIQHYFFAAWIPPAEEETQYSTQALSGDGALRYIARSVSPARQLGPGQELDFSSRLYLGPKLQDRIPELAEGLEYTVNYGIFTVFSKPLFWLLAKIHSVVGNWGWAIVILTILIKAAFFKLTEAQYRSTARMRKLQPRIEQLKERYGDDRQRMSQAMMEMYKQEKVNPLGGCLPILVQIPIFIALYWVLLESVELRQAPFILWIDNLSVRDPYFVLPVLNAVFMFATQRLTPMVGMDPLQQKMMQFMPIAFSIMFAFFPAGLVLYWATNAGLSLAQQYYITRKIAAAD
ncbi:MAG: membrane protein insertase YidC [Xanthomonadales bacterium]|nr:membrane protein insertase YidC [Xanthomonadales bacterium]